MADMVAKKENVKQIPKGTTVTLDWDEYQEWFTMRNRNRLPFFEKTDIFETVDFQSGHHLIRATHQSGKKVLAWVPAQFVIVTL